MADFFTVFKKLLPPSRLFRLPFGSDINKFFQSQTGEPQRVKTHIDTVRDDGIPGRISSFAIDDWEADLAIPKNNALTISERNERVVSKFAGNRGLGKDSLQEILRAAGFDVYVHEVIPAVDPDTYLASDDDIIAYGSIPTTFLESETAFGETAAIFGETSYVFGAQTTGRTVTSPTVPPSSTLWYGFFYIGAEVFPNRAQVALSRKNEFISLVLSTKRASRWCGALIDYV